MARIVENKKGFKVIEVSSVSEMLGGLGICDCCNMANFSGYYIAVLDMWYCKECYDEFIESATMNEEDIQLEDANFQIMCNELNLK